MGAGSTSGKYVYINSTLTKNSMNNYTVSVTITKSSTGVFNGFGQRVYAHIGSTAYLLGEFEIPSGSFSKTLTKSFSVTSNTYVNASTVCSWCEDRKHTDHSSEFSNSTSSDLAIYENPAPTKPVLVFESMGKSTYVDGPSGKIYAGTKDDGNANSVQFYIGMPGGATKSTVNLQYKFSNDSNWYNASGFPHASSELYHRVTKTFDNSDRHSNKGVLWRAWATASNSGGISTGDYIYFHINDLPTLDSTKISLSTRRTADSFTINIPTVNDSLANGTKKLRIHLYKYSNGAYQNFKHFDVNDTRSVSVNLSDYGFEKGEWCKVHVEPYDALELSRNHYTNGNCTIVRNSIPKFSLGTKILTDVDGTPYNKYFLNNVKITIPVASDAEDQTIKYLAYYKKRANSSSAWSNWTSIGSLDTSREKNLTPSMNGGEQVQFGAIAYDELEYSQSVSGNGNLTVMSDVLTKASSPSAPSTITISPSLSSGTSHYESINSISWSSVTACNGTNVTNFKVGVEVKQSSGATSLTLDTTKNVSDTTSTNWDITTTSFVRGYYFRFKVTAVDMFGLSSSIKYSSWFTRNKVPGAVPAGTFKANSSKNNFYKSIPLKWDNATDPDDDAVTYSIHFSKNRGEFNLIASNISNLSYTHDISNLTPGTTLGYKITAYDKFGIASTETIIDNCHNLVVNTPPKPIEVLYPTSHIYDKNPRIIFKTKGDTNNDSVTVVVTHNGEVFNSATSPSMFNKTSLNATNDYAVFIPKDLNEGENILSFKAFDGFEYSTETIYRIIYTTPLLNKIGENNEVLISKDSYDKFITMINDNRTAYGLVVNSFNPVTSNSSFITATDFNKLYTSIIDVNNFINNSYPGLNRIKIKPAISKNNLILKDIYNSILDIIINL